MAIEQPTVHGSGSHFRTASGRVYYEVEGAGPTVLLVPGGPGVAHLHYHPWFSRLANAHRVVYFDQLGTGRSDRLASPDGYTIELYSETIEALRVELGVERVSLIGLSFGALPALDYAARHGERLSRLVLSNGQLSAKTWQASNIDNVNRELQSQFPELWSELLEMRERGVRSLDPDYQALIGKVLPHLEWLDPWNHPPLARSDDAREGFQEDVYRAFVGEDPEWVVTGTLKGFDPAPALRDVTVPTLVITGRHDRVTTPSVAHAILDALPRAPCSLVVFERSAHRPWVEEADGYFELVEQFLADDAASR